MPCVLLAYGMHALASLDAHTLIVHTCNSCIQNINDNYSLHCTDVDGNAMHVILYDIRAPRLPRPGRLLRNDPSYPSGCQASYNEIRAFAIPMDYFILVDGSEPHAHDQHDLTWHPR